MRNLVGGVMTPPYEVINNNFLCQATGPGIVPKQWVLRE